MTPSRDPPSIANGFQAVSAAWILESHQRLTGRALSLPGGAEGDAGRALYEAPVAVLAHDMAADPVFFYANQLAQRLFGMEWDAMVRLPSRHSAEPLARAERQRLLDRVAAQGFIDDYAGVRISRTGQRFRIERATVWNLLDIAGDLVGQAAAFDCWTPLNAATAEQTGRAVS